MGRITIAMPPTKPDSRHPHQLVVAVIGNGGERLNLITPLDASDFEAGQVRWLRLLFDTITASLKAEVVNAASLLFKKGLSPAQLTLERQTPLMVCNAVTMVECWWELAKVPT